MVCWWGFAERADISLRKKLDASVYLVNIIVPFLAVLCWVLSGLALFGVIRISNAFPWVFTLANGFSFLPLYFIGLWKERGDYPVWQIVPLTFVGAVYTFHWIPCIFMAAIKMVAKKPVWKKTPVQQVGIIACCLVSLLRAEVVW